MMRLLIAVVVLAALAIGPSSAPASAPQIAAVPIADYQWDWDGFKRFWKKQLGKTSGVVGTVMLVVGGGVLVVMSTKRK